MEPRVDVAQNGGPRVTYQNVQPEMVPRLVEEHLVQGRVLTEWSAGRLDEEVFS
jgi:(2Fe-2S) ferredoxin